MTIPQISTPLVGIGLTEGLVIIVAILVLFGATRLPKLGKGIGEGIRNFKNGLKGDEPSKSGPPGKPDESEDDKS